MDKYDREFLEKFNLDKDNVLSDMGRLQFFYDFYSDYPLSIIPHVFTVSKLTGYSIGWLISRESELFLLLKPRMEYKRCLARLRLRGFFRLFIMGKKLEMADQHKKRKSILSGINKIKFHLKKLNAELAEMKVHPTYEEIRKIFGT